MERWYIKKHFLPRDIQHNPYWQKLSDNGKKWYRFHTEHSWLTKRSPHRRYCRHTDKQVAAYVGVSDRQARRYKKYCLDNHLLILVTPGNSGTTSKTGRPTAPVFEIPASVGQIYWWSRTRRRRKKKSPHRKEDGYV